MCGIAGFHLSAAGIKSGFPVTRLAAELLLGIESRGRHATGYAAVTYGKNKKPKVVCHKLPVAASDFIKVDAIPPDAHAAILHTRWATQGKPEFAVNNHPVNLNSCFVVHNGHINNDDELVEKTVGAAHRIGEVDSFAIPAALCHHGIKEDKDLEAGLHELEGGFAIAVLDPIQIPQQLILAKGDSSPLSVLITSAGIFWASEKKALEEAWGKVIGTPPKKYMPWHIRERDDNELLGQTGFLSMNPGEFIRYRADESIARGRFEVAKHYTWWNNRSFKQPSWTCWPSNEECIFAHDCGDCISPRCKCYSENKNHPKLNRGIKWEELIKENPALPGILAFRGISKHDIIRKTKHQTPRPVVVTASCDFCDKPEPEALLINIPMADGMKYKCAQCVMKGGNRILEAVKEPVEPEKPDPLGITIEYFEERAQEVCTIIDDALTVISWEFNCTPEFARYVIFYQKKMPANSEYGKYQQEIRQAFERAHEESKAIAKNTRGD